MKEYNKPPLTYKQQIELLKSRGLMFENIEQEAKAEMRLMTISYYRLSGYMIPFRKRTGGGVTDEFRYGTTWNQVYSLYKFDRKLRILVFDAIEKIEVAVRCQIVYQLSHKYGSHWQDDPSIFQIKRKTLSNGNIETIDVFKEIQDHIKDQLGKKYPEVFIEHYKNTYEIPKNPPSWMCAETMYFKDLSKICSALKKRSDLTEIANFFGLPPKIFTSWLHTMNYVRNICAHHARLWNREINIEPALLEFVPKFAKGLIWLSNPQTENRRKLYYFLATTNYLLQTVNPESTFTHRLKELFVEFPDVHLGAMGFSENWSKEFLWQKTTK